MRILRGTTHGNTSYFVNSLRDTLHRAVTSLVVEGEIGGCVSMWTLDAADRPTASCENSFDSAGDIADGKL